jgi:biopolymer transport protein ExbB
MAEQTQVMQDNPFGIQQMLAQGGVVAKSVFAIMVIMSFASWYIMLTKLWDQRRIRKAYKEVEKGFWTAGNLRDGIAKLTGKDNAFKLIAEDGIRAAQHHEGRLTDQIPLHEWITVSLHLRWTALPTGCRAASPCWRPPARRLRSSACSARCGASTTR